MLFTSSNQVRTDENRSEWMNETWGPPIKDQNGKPAKRYTAGTGDGQKNSSQLQRLTPQYSRRKRRGNTPPDDLPPKKKLKKAHKKFTAPLSGEGQKKLVLLPPKPPVPDGRSCVRCKGLSRSFGRLTECFKCHRAAFCGNRCRSKQGERSCSSLCASETLSNHQAEDEAIWSGLAAVSNIHKTDVDMKDTSESSGKEDSDSDSTPSPDSDEDGELRFEEAEGWNIINFEISKNGRLLNYVLQCVETAHPSLYAAEYMFGREWDEKIFWFWRYNKDAARRRAAMEKPFGNVEKAPDSLFGKYILSARFDDDRHLDFNTRDIEGREPDEDGEYTLFELAADLGPQWDEAIELYWKRVRIHLDWNRREEMIKRMDIV